VKASAKLPRACSAKRLVMGCVSFLRAPLRPVHGHYAGERSQVATTKTDQNVSAVRCLLVHLLMSALGDSCPSGPSSRTAGMGVNRHSVVLLDLRLPPELPPDGLPKAGTQKYAAEGTHGVLLRIWAHKVERSSWWYGCFQISSAVLKNRCGRALALPVATPRQRHRSRDINNINALCANGAD
jgi:hypothetical protein